MSLLVLLPMYEAMLATASPFVVSGIRHRQAAGGTGVENPSFDCANDHCLVPSRNRGFGWCARESNPCCVRRQR